MAALNVTLLEGEDQETGDPLLTLPPAKLTGRIGLRVTSQSRRPVLLAQSGA